MDCIKECREKMDDVTVSIVGGYLSPEQEKRCASIADEIGVKFRIR